MTLDPRMSAFHALDRTEQENAIRRLAAAGLSEHGIARATMLSSRSGASSAITDTSPMGKRQKWVRRLVRRLREEYRRHPPRHVDSAADRAQRYDFVGQDGEAMSAHRSDSHPPMACCALLGPSPNRRLRVIRTPVVA